MGTVKQEGQEGVGGRAPTGLGSQPPRRTGTAVPMGPSAGPGLRRGQSPLTWGRGEPAPGGLGPGPSDRGHTDNAFDSGNEQSPSGTLWPGASHPGCASTQAQDKGRLRGRGCGSWSKARPTLEGIPPPRPAARPPVLQPRLCLLAIRGNWFNQLLLSSPLTPG